MTVHYTYTLVLDICKSGSSGIRQLNCLVSLLSNTIDSCDHIITNHSRKDIDGDNDSG